MNDSNKYFAKPENPFLLIYEIDNRISYIWVETEEEIIDIINELEEYHKGEFIIQDCIEIGSAREIDWKGLE